ncbi:MAG: ABC transporter substrate-binding protein [Agathobaculum desmolans]|uniref:ABC transporter substrate-binding protein n=1 Tax=Agathobaculum desmolans TaxID=39484 RepID=UPI0039930B51
MQKVKCMIKEVKLAMVWKIEIGYYKCIKSRTPKVKKGVYTEMKKLQRGISTVVAAALMVGSLAGCGTNPSSNGKDEGSTGSSSETLNVGVLVSTVGIPALYAEDQGWFEEAGLDVNLITFPTGAPVNEAIAAQELDIACSGFASVYSLANAGCVWLADINSTGGMGIYAREDSDIVKAGKNLTDYPEVYGSAEALKGVQILEPLGTSAQFATESYLAKFGLTGDDVEQVHMEYAPAFQAFETGEGDLNSCSPPYSYDMVDAGYVEVCSFEDATDVSMCDGCFARGEVVENRADDVQKFVDVLVRAMDALQDEQLRFDYTIERYASNAQDFTDDQMRREIEDRKYYGKDLLSKQDYVFGECWGAITDFLVKVEKITEDNAPNVISSLDPSFVESATGLTVQRFEK